MQTSSGARLAPGTLNPPLSPHRRTQRLQECNEKSILKLYRQVVFKGSQVTRMMKKRTDESQNVWSWQQLIFALLISMRYLNSPYNASMLVGDPEVPTAIGCLIDSTGGNICLQAYGPRHNSPSWPPPWDLPPESQTQDLRNPLQLQLRIPTSADLGTRGLEPLPDVPLPAWFCEMLPCKGDWKKWKNEQLWWQVQWTSPSGSHLISHLS